MDASRHTQLPPWGDHGAGAVHRTEDVPFQVQEPLHPVPVQNLLEQSPRPLLNEQVHIHKSIAQSLGQHHAYAAFAGTRHADQNNIIVHSDLSRYTMGTRKLCHTPMGILRQNIITKKYRKGKSGPASRARRLFPCAENRLTARTVRRRLPGKTGQKEAQPMRTAENF